MADGFFEIAELAGGAAELELAFGCDDGDARGIIAAVFEAAQAVEDEGDDFLMADVSDDAAHSQFLPEFQTSTSDASDGREGGAMFHRRKGLAAVTQVFGVIENSRRRCVVTIAAQTPLLRPSAKAHRYGGAIFVALKRSSPC